MEQKNRRSSERRSASGRKDDGCKRGGGGEIVCVNKTDFSQLTGRQEGVVVVVV